MLWLYNLLFSNIINIAFLLFFIVDIFTICAMFTLFCNKKKLVIDIWESWTISNNLFLRYLRNYLNLVFLCLLCICHHRSGYHFSQKEKQVQLSFKAIQKRIILYSIIIKYWELLINWSNTWGCIRTWRSPYAEKTVSNDPGR